MKQFSLNEYFKDVNKKVVTREGKQVRIICTDAPVKNYPIAGYATGVDNKWHGPYSWSKDGERQIASPVPSENDLFFTDEEDELTEFEKGMKCIIRDIKNGDAVEDYKFWSQRLLDLAKKQLQPDIDKEIDNAYKTRDEVVYFEGYEKGKEDALKEKNFVDINKGK